MTESDLDRFGPEAAYPTPTLDEASAYCRTLARSHYENFTVASWLLPKRLRRHFHHLYAYCRWADDLADESGSPEAGMALLDWWERELDGCFAGQARHPVFVALAETIREFEIPRAPLADLLIAFRQDQSVTEYETFDQLLGYCRNSANPVGRLVLYLGRCPEPSLVELSDSICTGLQLANFWQDVARDWTKGRVYLPREDRQKFGYSDAALSSHEFNDAFRELLAFQVDRAEQFLTRGRLLVEMVPRELRIDVELFVRGGLEILSAIRREDCNVWLHRPQLSRWQKAKLLMGAFLEQCLPKSQKRQRPEEAA